MWSALRHRRGQVLVLLLVSALVATCAAFAPIFARSVDQAVLRTHVEQADPNEVATGLTYTRDAGRKDKQMPRDIEAKVPAALTAISKDPIGDVSTATQIPPVPGKQPSPLVVRAPDDVCGHVTITKGSCPDAPGEILVSRADVRAWGWEQGRTFAIGQERPSPFAPQPPDVELTVVGVYQVTKAAPGYWLENRPDGKSGVPQPGLDSVPGIDDFLTTPATFEKYFPGAVVSVQLPLDPSRATLDSLPRAAAASDRMAKDDPAVSVSQSVGELVDEVSVARSQTAIIVPFVALQLGLLAVVVLFLVAQAAVEQRRHDVALARLRGRSRAGARRLLLSELAVPVLLGVPVGLLAAMGLAVVVRRLVLPPDIPYEVPLVVLVWLLAALLVSLAAVAVAARPVLREPVSRLLREVAPAPSGGPHVVEAIIVVLALVSVGGLASGTISGPAALAAPTLLAIAVGLVAARLLPPLATRRAARAMRRGHIAAVVAAHGIARHSSARRALVVTTVATAVAVFGANAVVVADANRQDRADLETGAPAVVTVSATSTTELMKVAQRLQEKGVETSPVVTIKPSDPGADATIAVDPQAFAGVTNDDLTAGLDLKALRLPEQDPIMLKGKHLTGEVSWDLTRTRGIEGRPSLKVDITTASGDELTRDLHVLGPKDHGSDRIHADLLCPSTCRLDGLRVASTGSTGSRMTADVKIKDLGVDGRALPVDGEGTWREPGEGAGGPGLTVTTKGDTLELNARSRNGTDVTAVVADVPRPLPALVSGTKGAADRDITTIAGGQATVHPEQTVAALPAVTDQGVLVSLPALSRLSRAIDPERGRAQLWLADASPSSVDRARDVAVEEGLGVRSVETTSRAKQAYDRSASAWGLQLALLAGVLAVLLGALVLLVLAVTGWRAVVADVAALRVSGVARADAARAARTENLLTVAVGIVLGVVCAVIGAAVAMPSVPLFTEPAAVPVPDFSTAWWAVGLAALVTAVLLLAISLLLARWVMGRVRLAAARGESM